MHLLTLGGKKPASPHNIFQLTHNNVLHYLLAPPPTFSHSLQYKLGQIKVRAASSSNCAMLLEPAVVVIYIYI